MGECNGRMYECKTILKKSANLAYVVHVCLLSCVVSELILQSMAI